jgi:hypothetical protein
MLRRRYRNSAMKVQTSHLCLFSFPENFSPRMKLFIYTQRAARLNVQRSHWRHPPKKNGGREKAAKEKLAWRVVAHAPFDSPQLHRYFSNPASHHWSRDFCYNALRAALDDGPCHWLRCHDFVTLGLQRA